MTDDAPERCSIHGCEMAGEYCPECFASESAPQKQLERTVIACKLDMSHCDHDFGADGDVCEKCGTSVWAWAFMECP